MVASGKDERALRWRRALAGAAVLAALGGVDPAPALAGEGWDVASRPGVSAAVPFCETGSRKKMAYIDSPDGHLVELLGRVFRTCNKPSLGAFLLSADPRALPGLRFPDTLLTLSVASPFSPAVPSGEWGAFVWHVMMSMQEGARIERWPDRVIGDTVYNQYLKSVHTSDGSTLFPAVVYLIPAPDSDGPERFIECRGPVVGLRRFDDSHCTMWLRYKGLKAQIWFRHVGPAFPDPIPIEQFDAYAQDVLYVLTALDVTDRAGEFGDLDYTVIDLGPYAPPTGD